MPRDLDSARALGQKQSKLVTSQALPKSNRVPDPDLEYFAKQVKPVLQESCAHCHDGETTEGNFRVDTLDPDLASGQDLAWWIEVMDVLANGEMPPADEPTLNDTQRGEIVEWVSTELHHASLREREVGPSSTFRRMTRYEYNYALQDLLGLPYDYANDLPPDPISDSGFKNNARVLQITPSQFSTYQQIARRALDLATVSGTPPDPLYWHVDMQYAASEMRTKYEAEVRKRIERFKDEPERQQQELAKLAAKHGNAPTTSYYKDLNSGAMFRAQWSYRGARYAWNSTRDSTLPPEASGWVAVLPPRQRLIVELGNEVPDRGILRVRIRASKSEPDTPWVPSLALEFGFQASNNSSASSIASTSEIVVDAAPDKPKFYEWEIPLSQVRQRNPMRRTAEMGDTPNPSEYLKLVNTSVSGGEVQIDYVEVTAPYYKTWPPESHLRVFENFENMETVDDLGAKKILSGFMSKAWNREPLPVEVDKKVELLQRLAPICDSRQEAMLEVMASVLSSPRFLYRSAFEHNPVVGQSPLKGSDREDRPLTHPLADRRERLAERLAAFLWCSIPDQELRQSLNNTTYAEKEQFEQLVEQLLKDPRAERLAQEFVTQWLNMEPLKHLEVDRERFPFFDASLRTSMLQEPVELFKELLRTNGSVIDFFHADFVMVDERLANHYAIPNVFGNHFRKVPLVERPKIQSRGGLLSQAGLLAMNSDGKDSHPLKRGIWLLTQLLDDPPSPPPPTVPEIDLADPRIAEMTLKERLEDHRNDPACYSCHAKIDPWGIAFENFDAVGRWRENIEGEPVDSASELFNQQELDGMMGLKRFLLERRQDQFVLALVRKLVTFALGRPVVFRDRAEIERIARETRLRGDGLRDMIQLIVASPIFIE